MPKPPLGSSHGFIAKGCRSAIGALLAASLGPTGALPRTGVLFLHGDCPLRLGWAAQQRASIGVSKQVHEFADQTLMADAVRDALSERPIHGLSRVALLCRCKVSEALAGETWNSCGHGHVSGRY